MGTCTCSRGPLRYGTAGCRTEDVEVMVISEIYVEIEMLILEKWEF